MCQINIPSSQKLFRFCKMEMVFLPKRASKRAACCNGKNHLLIRCAPLPLPESRAPWSHEAVNSFRKQASATLFTSNYHFFFSQVMALWAPALRTGLRTIRRGLSVMKDIQTPLVEGLLDLRGREGGMAIMLRWVCDRESKNSHVFSDSLSGNYLYFK